MDTKSRHLTLKAWPTVCLPKVDGGLGIRMTSEVNQALLSKLAWKMISDKESIWVWVLSGKYLQGQDF